MRITGGDACGRKITTLKGRDIRPTSSRVREALFQILSVRFIDAWQMQKVLDLFAGSGTLGIEALSRGAARAVFADGSTQALDCIRSNLKCLGLSGASSLVKTDIKKKASTWNRLEKYAPFSLVFADPPYGKGFAGNVLELAASFPLLAPDGVLVLEESGRADISGKAAGEAGTLVMRDKRKYGQTALYFFHLDKA